MLERPGDPLDGSLAIAEILETHAHFCHEVSSSIVRRAPG